MSGNIYFYSDGGYSTSSGAPNTGTGGTTFVDMSGSGGSSTATVDDILSAFNEGTLSLQGMYNYALSGSATEVGIGILDATIEGLEANKAKSTNSSYINLVNNQIDNVQAVKDSILEQRESFNVEVSTATESYNASNDDLFNTYASDYYNSEFGDTDYFKEILEDLESIQEEIYKLDTIGSLYGDEDYNKLIPEDFSSDISSLIDKEGELKNKIDDFISSYNKNEEEAIRKETQDFLKEVNELREKDSFDNWNVSLEYVPSPEYGGFSGGINYFDYLALIQDAKRLNYTSNFVGGLMSYWMAGGDLYDSPRAGDIRFDPTGDLNTTRFLGMDDKNITNWTEWKNNKYHDYSTKVFGSMPGDTFFVIRSLMQ